MFCVTCVPYNFLRRFRYPIALLDVRRLWSLLFRSFASRGRESPRNNRVQPSPRYTKLWIKCPARFPILPLCSIRRQLLLWITFHGRFSVTLAQVAVVRLAIFQVAISEWWLSGWQLHSRNYTLDQQQRTGSVFLRHLERLKRSSGFSNYTSLYYHHETTL